MPQPQKVAILKKCLDSHHDINLVNNKLLLICSGAIVHTCTLPLGIGTIIINLLQAAVVWFKDTSLYEYI